MNNNARRSEVALRHAQYATQFHVQPCDERTFHKSVYRRAQNNYADCFAASPDCLPISFVGEPLSSNKRGAIARSGNTASAAPSLTALPGIPHTTLDASSCAT